jgi:cholesterol oxidase
MSQDYDFDYIIVGSGFGGSVSACRLTEKGYSVGVMEMGLRWTPQTLPRTNWNLRRWFWRPGLKMFGFYNMHRFRHAVIGVGNAVGGGSITYANTLLVPPDSVWEKGSWAGLRDWKQVMPGHYATAERMLGVTETKILGEADLRLKRMAEGQGVGHTFHRTRVGTFFPPEGEAGGKTYPDPYFGGEGPERTTCTGCGGCTLGCRVGAKNTLDKNYLYFAEKRGARVFAETRVVDVRPLGGKADGSEGYEVHTERSTTWFARAPRRFRCRGVVFAASSLGTQELLFRLKDRGSLPNISDRLGKEVRTNAESILGVRFPAGDKNMTEGVAIGSGIYIDQHTHIEAFRVPDGSDFFGLMFTLLCGGTAGWTRIFTWLWTLLKNPLLAMRIHWPFGWSRQTIGFLVMQTLDAHLDMRFKRSWYWPLRKAMVSEGPPIPTYIPQANAFAEKAAKALGGVPMTMLTEILFNVPSTGHCMGGCGMGDSPTSGVIDGQNRVYGYRNMLICDGSTLSANLGVNPSLTITALAEHAMSYIPARSTQP